MQNAVTVLEPRTALQAQSEINPALFYRFVQFVDATPRTIETYKKALLRFGDWLASKRITRPTREDVIAYRDELEQSHKPTTVQTYITAVRLFFKWLDAEGKYPNIADHVKGAKLSKLHKREYLTSSQIKAVLGSFEKVGEHGSRDYAMIALMVTCGLRTIEVVRANIEDLRTRGDSTVIYVQGKGQSERADFVKVSEHVEASLRAYLKTRGTVSKKEPLFTSTSNNSKGCRLSTRTIREVVKSRLRNAGFDDEKWTAHSLRHTAVTLALLAGKRLDEAQQFARHANIATTMIYNHAIDRDKNSCNEAVSQAIFKEIPICES